MHPGKRETLQNFSGFFLCSNSFVCSSSLVEKTFFSLVEVSGFDLGSLYIMYRLITANVG